MEWNLADDKPSLFHDKYHYVYSENPIGLCWSCTIFIIWRGISVNVTPIVVRELYPPNYRRRSNNDSLIGLVLKGSCPAVTNFVWLPATVTFALRHETWVKQVEMMRWLGDWNCYWGAQKRDLQCRIIFHRTACDLLHRLRGHLTSAFNCSLNLLHCKRASIVAGSLK